MMRVPLQFDADAYSMDAIQRAAYRFSDRLAIDIGRVDGTIACTLLVTAEVDDVEELAAAFRNEVLDQTLRERIRTETSDVRNLILALAFSQTGLTESS